MNTCNDKTKRIFAITYLRTKKNWNRDSCWGVGKLGLLTGNLALDSDAASNCKYALGPQSILYRIGETTQWDIYKHKY